MALAAKLEDRSYALEKLLGPALRPEGSGERLLSEEVAELTAHLYTPDRVMYQEGMKVAAKYKEQEAELRVGGCWAGMCHAGLLAGGCCLASGCHRSFSSVVLHCSSWQQWVMHCVGQPCVMYVLSKALLRCPCRPSTAPTPTSGRCSTRRAPRCRRCLPAWRRSRPRPPSLPRSWPP
jgi:hypothetical protein